MTDLTQLILHLETSEDVEDFLRGFFTPGEVQQLETRLEIIKLLKKGAPHRDIARKLNVGVATVTRGSRELNQGRFNYV